MVRSRVNYDSFSPWQGLAPGMESLELYPGKNNEFGGIFIIGRKCRHGNLKNNEDCPPNSSGQSPLVSCTPCVRTVVGESDHRCLKYSPPDSNLHGSHQSSILKARFRAGKLLLVRIAATFRATTKTRTAAAEKTVKIRLKSSTSSAQATENLLLLPCPTRPLPRWFPVRSPAGSPGS